MTVAAGEQGPSLGRAPGEQGRVQQGAQGQGVTWAHPGKLAEQDEESEPARMSPKSTSGEMLGRLAQ